MSELKNVSVKREANIYYGGQVSSRTLTFDDGTKKTLGFVLPGNYMFSTNSTEIIEILSGEGNVVVNGEKIDYSKNSEFTVPSHIEFEFNADTVTDYCCSYIED